MMLCKCAVLRALLANAERGMRGLSRAAPVAGSPLLNLTESDAWITAKRERFMSHLRHVVLRRSPMWGFKVVSDADLMQAWLATAALRGEQILDPDAAEQTSRASLTYLTLVDIALPPQLLVIRLGVKKARNVAMPEVFMESLMYRAHAGKPTWVWDDPGEPLAEGHISYSREAREVLEDWPHLRDADLEAEVARPTKKSQAVEKTSTASGLNVRDAFMGKGGKK